MFAEKTLEILRRFVAEYHNGVTLHASKWLGVPNDTLDRWLKGQRDPGLSKIGPLIDKILWGHSEPEKIGVLEIKYPEVQGGADCAKYIERIKDLEIENARLREELIGERAIAKRLEGLLERQLPPRQAQAERSDRLRIDFEEKEGNAG